MVIWGNFHLWSGLNQVMRLEFRREKGASGAQKR